MNAMPKNLSLPVEQRPLRELFTHEIAGAVKEVHALARIDSSRETLAAIAINTHETEDDTFTWPVPLGETDFITLRRHRLIFSEYVNRRSYVDTLSTFGRIALHVITPDLDGYTDGRLDFAIRPPYADANVSADEIAERVRAEMIA